MSPVLPGGHLIAPLLKRWIIGTLHHRKLERLVERERLPLSPAASLVVKLR